jgi:hypothetical protein
MKAPLSGAGSLVATRARTVDRGGEAGGIGWQIFFTPGFPGAER